MLECCIILRVSCWSRFKSRLKKQKSGRSGWRISCHYLERDELTDGLLTVTATHEDDAIVDLLITMTLHIFFSYKTMTTSSVVVTLAISIPFSVRGLIE